MPDFWRHSGYHLLERRGNGLLGVTDAFLRAYVERPEMRLVAESCDAERALHAALVRYPREAVSADRVAALADADARDNYRVMLEVRDRLAAAGLVDDRYLGLFRDGARPAGVPALFPDQLAQVVLRGLLAEAPPLRLRAAELLFRAQTVMLRDGQALLGDHETVEMYSRSAGFGGLGRLLAEARTPMRRVELDVLGEDNAEVYWERDERHDTVLDLTFGRPGLDALARVLEAWVGHFTGAAVNIQPVARISDERWVWHVGLDAEASAILNDLYTGAEVDEARLARIVALFRLEFADATLMLPRVAGRPVYLAAAMDTTDTLRLKPQNLLVNLPLAPRA